LIRRGGIVPLRNLAAERKRFPMTDLIYIALGIAALGVFGLYALALKRI